MGPIVSLTGISVILLMTAVTAAIFSQHKSDMHTRAFNTSTSFAARPTLIAP
jgi:hypothetical protein